MIGHPSGDEPLMVDVRQSGSGSFLHVVIAPGDTYSLLAEFWNDALYALSA
jgi:hypothetical protein